MAQYVYSMIGVGKTVPPGKQILRDISLSFFPGAKIGVLGLNGSGKSTLLRIMAGIDLAASMIKSPNTDALRLDVDQHVVALSNLSARVLRKGILQFMTMLCSQHFPEFVKCNSKFEQ